MTESTAARLVLPAVAEIVCWWAVTGLVWVATVSSMGAAEIVCAAVAGLVCAVFARRLRLTLGFRIGLPHVGGAWRAWPAALVADIGMCVEFLVRALAGRPRLGQTRTRQGPRGTSADATTRRCAAALMISSTPGTLVLDTDPHTGELVLHALWTGPVRLESRVLA